MDIPYEVPPSGRARFAHRVLPLGIGRLSVRQRQPFRQSGDIPAVRAGLDGPLCGSCDHVGVDLYAACLCQSVKLAIMFHLYFDLLVIFPDFSSITTRLYGYYIGLLGGSSAVYSPAAGKDYVAIFQTSRCL